MKKPTTNQTRLSNNISEVKATYKSSEFQANRKQIHTSNDAYQTIKNIYDIDGSIDHYESMFIILLNRQNKELGWAKISQGGVSGTVVDPKIVFQYALITNASGIILAHNHPSGNLSASDEDLKLTKKLVEAGKLLEITILDHLIVTKDGYLSLSDSGII